MKRQWILLGISVILLAVLLGLTGVWEQKTNQVQEKIKNGIADSQEYDRQIRDITEDIKRQEETIQVSTGGYVIFAFSAGDDKLMSDIFPLLNSYGIQGTVILKNGVLPSGQEGMLSAGEYQQLLEAGWDTGIGGPGEEDSQQTAALLSQFQEQLVQAGYSEAVTYIFDGSEYFSQSAGIYPVLLEQGFQIIGAKARSEESLVSAINTQRNHMVECQNTSLVNSTETLLHLTEQSAARQMPVIFSDYSLSGKWEEAQCDDTVLTNLKLILDKLKEESSQCQGGSIGEYLRLKEEAEQKTEENQKAFESYKKQKEQEIESIREKKYEL